ncbi:unnamed protein product [Bathycoccus prasinos]
MSREDMARLNKEREAREKAFDSVEAMEKFQKNDFQTPTRRERDEENVEETNNEQGDEGSPLSSGDERMSFRDGIIFKIASPHTEKIYIGCSSLPLNRAVSGLRASAKFRKLSCNILFQAGDIQSEVLEKFQDITVLEMRKKLGTIQTQYLEKCVNTNRAGRTNADRYRETKRQLEMYRENKDTFNRKHALKNMRIRGLPPRRSTILKYNITDEEIADCCKRV